MGKLLPWHEVKAFNGIVWKHKEAFLTENADKCSYVGSGEFGDQSDYAIPTRGNCRECGANGPLGKICINMCMYVPTKYMVRDKEDKEKYPFLKKWIGEDRYEYKRAKYQMMMTPDKEGIVDAEFFSLACAKVPETDVERNVMNFLSQKHKIRARVSSCLMKAFVPKNEELLKFKKVIFQLREDDVMWKKVVKLCEDKGYGHPTNLKKNAVHIPDWNTYGLPFDQDGKTTLQELVDSSKTVDKDDSRDPSDDLVRGS